MDVNICTFSRIQFPTYARLIEASNGELPERCPIPKGVYKIRHLRIELDKYPPLKGKLNGNARITVHKNTHILAKFDIKISLQI